MMDISEMKEVASFLLRQISKLTKAVSDVDETAKIMFDLVNKAGNGMFKTESEHDSLGVVYHPEASSEEEAAYNRFAGGDYPHDDTTYFVTVTVQSPYHNRPEDFHFRVDPTIPPCMEGEDHHMELEGNPQTVGGCTEVKSVCVRCGAELTSTVWVSHPDTDEPNVVIESWGPHKT